VGQGQVEAGVLRVEVAAAGAGGAVGVGSGLYRGGSEIEQGRRVARLDLAGGS
jgi:hypothetical protein